MERSDIKEEGEDDLDVKRDLDVAVLHQGYGLLSDENRFFKPTKSNATQNTNEMYFNAKLIGQRH